MKRIRSRDVEKANPSHWIVIPLLITAALFVYKTNSSLRVIYSTWTSGTIAARPQVVTFGQQVNSIGAIERSVNYFAVIWPALVFGILIGAAVRAFVSPRLLARFAKEKAMKTQLAAGLAGAPLMLCSCCVAPVFASVAETSGRLGPALGLMLASPALNPAAIALTFMLFALNVAVARLLLALSAVILIGPTVERMLHHIGFRKPIERQLIEHAIESSAVSKFLKSLAEVFIRTVPGLIVGVVASMLIVQWLPVHFFTSAGAKFAAILLTATVAVPLALPTFLEIPLALSLLAAGFPAGAAIALLFAGPAVNLPSLLSVARVAGWRIAVLVAALVWILAVTGGLLIG